ncbi:amidohydrolase family protein [candidate division KSB1 bacterium]|nr:amidohydrolase family protein [candidate division KSB1 bacterium]
MKKSLLKIFFVSVSLFLIGLSGCTQKTPDYAAFPKIDAHVHLGHPEFNFAELGQKNNIRLMTLCTRASSQEYIDRQYDLYSRLHEQNPDVISYASTFTMEGWGEPDWQTKTIQYLQSTFDRGAIAVKVWKDIGMTFRKPDSSFIMIDDPSFDPILDYIASQGKTVVAHIAEPKGCWLPLDSIIVLGDRNYFKNNPQYHMYLHPDYPSYMELINARDNMLAKHPDLRVVGCHLGSLEWDVDELAKRLDKYPNFAVDISARIAHLQYQDRDKVRNFLKKYKDRILYGTDITITPNMKPEAIETRYTNSWKADWQYFTTDQELTSRSLSTPFQGLKLDTKILKKIYYENALKWYPGMER